MLHTKLSLIILIPARGRKRKLCKAFYFIPRIILIPARGRKHPPPLLASSELADYTHPRKGTETRMDLLSLGNGIRLYSSPQGDGNRILSSHDASVERLYSSPQGDGNKLFGCHRLLFTDYTHPRKGTETQANCCPSCIVADYTHPRKGTETAMASASAFLDYTHPRKGTETSCPSCSKCALLWIILIPARGRKLTICLKRV